ncbi:MAG: helix-turn-helix transcriptional regulator [Firmicutes bacterium]|nr:helix-turn-helix transcriptional regulator [Bacillota bacterium]
MSRHTDPDTQLDYAAIGLRIKNARKRKGMTQERLAEKVDLSTPHMSHIESGKTKVSLPSLVLIANALETTVDSLLHDNITVTQTAFDKEFKDLTEDCTMHEKQLIYTAAREVKKALKKGTL